jgi:hypothetical protein
MKILFDNAAKRATISSENKIENYPADNLVSQFIEERWQEDSLDPPSAVITITFDDPEAIDSLFFSYTNITGIVAITDTGAIAHGSMDDIEATETGDEIVTDDGDYIGIVEDVESMDAIYFDGIQDGVNVLTLYVYGEENPIYLGGIGVGLGYKMPDPVGVISEGFEDNSQSDGSVYGQRLQSFIEPLRDESYNFYGVKRDIVKEIWEQYLSVGIGGKVWFDVTEKNHSFKLPMYCEIRAVPATSKDGTLYSFNMNFREAR